jgi:hypothetical protein
MEFLVASPDSMGVVALGGSFRVGDDVSESEQLFWRCPFGCPPGCVHLKRLAHLEKLIDVFIGQCRHHHPTIGIGRHEPFTAQEVQGISYRNARHTQFGRKRAFDQTHPRRILTHHDPLTDLVGNLVPRERVTVRPVDS